MADTRIRRCLDPGMTVLVGSVDASGVPSCCRGIALTSNDALATVSVYVPMGTSRDTMTNLATTKRMAVTSTYPPDHSSIQLKGLTMGARLAHEEEAEFLKARLEALAGVLDSLGIPKRVLLRMTYWPAFAIDMRVHDIFEQTPGPKAGARLK